MRKGYIYRGDFVIDSQTAKRLYEDEVNKNGLSGAYARAAARAGIHRSTFRDKVISEPKNNLNKPSEMSMEERAEIQLLKYRNERLQRQNKESELALAHLQELERTAIAIRDKTPPLPQWAIDHTAKPDHPGLPIYHWSDWHLGEVVDPKQMHGYNAFNREIAEQRVVTLVRNSLMMTKEILGRHKPNGCVIFLGGDFVSGWLHQELIATDDMTPLQAMRTATTWLNAALLEMVKFFGKITVIGTPGNHGRLFHRPPGKLGAYQAFDWLVYGFLQDLFEHDKRFTFIIPGEGEYLAELNGRRYMFMHGHELGVKGGDGIIGAIGPIMRGAQKVGRSSASIGRDFDTLVIGHYHQPLLLPGIICNNAIKGFDEYARRERYRATPPSQVMWFSHAKYGVVHFNEIFVEKPGKVYE